MRPEGQSVSPAAGASLFTDRYTSAQQFEREQQTVFRKSWIIAARASDLARPSDWLPFDELGPSLILGRGTDGIARAFRNSCRHRGTRILCDRRQAPRLTCPYHGWQYDLEGKLIRVPAAEGFENLDMASHGLEPVRCESYAGFIWISFDPHAPPLREFLGALTAELDPYCLEDMQPIGHKTWTLSCNWKAFIDNNIERYHVAAVHPLWSGALAIEHSSFHDLGIHQLFSVSLANYRWRAALDRLTQPKKLILPAEKASLYQRYLVFPNTLISVTPHQMTVFRVFPLAPGTCRFHYEFHVRHNASPLAKLRGWLVQFASLRIVAEDNAILELLQRGLAAAGRQPIPLHRQEQLLKHFHGVVDRYVEQG